MPFKNPSDKLAWRREYAKRFPNKISKWRYDWENKHPHVVSEDRRIEIANKKNDKKNKRDIADVAGAIREIKHRILERDGLCICYMCKKAKPYKDMAKICGRRKTCGTCIVCARKEKRAWKNGNGKDYSNHYMFERMKRDKLFLFKQRTRDRIAKGVRSFARGAKVSNGKLRYLGCTTKEAFLYIQSQFVTGMTWDNYGKAWHIDHVIPLCSFDLSIEEERKKAFCYSNMRPLWAMTNMRKGGRPIEKPYQPSLLLV